MAIQDEQETTRRILRKQSFPVYKYIRVNFQMAWFVIWLVVSAVFFMYARSADQLVVGLLFGLVTFVLWFLLVAIRPFDGFQTAAISMGHRKASKAYHSWHGESTQVSERPEGGDRKARKTVIKRLGPISFIPHETEQGALGIAYDQRDKVRSSTLKISGPSMLSQSPDVRELRTTAYARLLDSMTDTSGLALQLRTREGEELDMKGIVQTLQAGSNLVRTDPPNREVLLRNGTRMGKEAVNHDLTMTVAMYGPDISVPKNIRGTQKVNRYREQVLVDRLKSFYSQLMGSGQSVGFSEAVFLTYNQLVWENFRALDPIGATQIESQWSGLPTDEYIDEEMAWPDTWDFESSGEWCKVGQTYHMGFYLYRFPRQGLRSNTFAKLLNLNVPKTVTVIEKTAPAGWSQQRAEWETNAVTLSNIDTEKSGRRVTEAEDIEATRIRTHERELAEEKGLAGDLRVYIDLVGPSLSVVEASKVSLFNAAKNADFIVRPLTDRQHLGIYATMPIARGLRLLPIPR